MEAEGAVESTSKGSEGVKINDVLRELVADGYSSEPECMQVEHLGRDRVCPSDSDKKKTRQRTRLLRSSSRVAASPLGWIYDIYAFVLEYSGFMHVKAKAT